jgi:hypothetical protein
MAWLVLLVLLALDGGLLWWWLRRQFLPLFFSGWAALLYVAVIAADFWLAWLVSVFTNPPGSGPLFALALVGAGAVLVTFLMTLFFRWVISHDMTDAP